MTFAYDFSRRRALITGASSGLGRHFALLLARQGVAGLALAARRRDRLEEVAAACGAAGVARVATIALDVEDERAVEAGLSAASEAMGGLDLLVNNAGMAVTEKALDATIEGFDRTMATNLRGPWLMAVGAARRMAGAGGDIVNIASILGLRVARGLAAYAISKAGLVQMTRALAVELAREGVRVNALAPGYFETEINREFFRSPAGEVMVKAIPARRIGRIEELDAPFLLLASGASPYLTGAVLTVDGGHHVNPL